MLVGATTKKLPCDENRLSGLSLFGHVRDTGPLWLNMYMIREELPYRSSRHTMVALPFEELNNARGSCKGVDLNIDKM